MHKFILLIMLVLTTFGCATVVNPIPEGYSGGTATVVDSFISQGRTKAQIFYLESVNGTKIENAAGNSQGASYGNGPTLTKQGASRDVPAQLMTMHLVGAVEHGAPIAALFSLGSNHRVEGDISFTPEMGKTYTVAGQLGKNYSAVWLEDRLGNVVSQRIELKGDNFDPQRDGAIRRRAPVSENGVVSREEVFLRIRGGESVEVVETKLGVPDSVSVTEKSLWSDRPGLTTYHYSGLGTVVFSQSNDQPSFVNQVLPAFKATGDSASVRTQLAAASGQGLQRLAQGYAKQPSHTVEVLDVFAEEIWARRAVEERFSVDAMAYLCNTLASSQNPRYRLVLQQVAETAVSKKLQRYASGNLKKLPVAQAPQYRPAGT